ncbi:MAG: hypothetical protein U1F25_10295 [Rubrivivax sp.]
MPRWRDQRPPSTAADAVVPARPLPFVPARPPVAALPFTILAMARLPAGEAAAEILRRPLEHAAAGERDAAIGQLAGQRRQRLFQLPAAWRARSAARRTCAAQPFELDAHEHRPVPAVQVQLGLLHAFAHEHADLRARSSRPKPSLPGAAFEHRFMAHRARVGG